MKKPSFESRCWVFPTLSILIFLKVLLVVVQFSSVAQSCPASFDRMSGSTPGLPSSAFESTKQGRGGGVMGVCVVWRKSGMGWSLAHLKPYSCPKPSLFILKNIKELRGSTSAVCLGLIPHPFGALFQICHMDWVSGEASLCSPPPLSPAP